MELPVTAYAQPLPPLRLPPRQAALGQVEWVALAQADGRVAAASAGLYPPGIPLVAPGEMITEQTAAALAPGGGPAALWCGKEKSCYVCGKGGIV